MKLIFIIFLIIFFYYLFYYIYEKFYYFDYSKFNKVKNMKIFQPKDVNDLQIFLKNNKSKFCILGAGFSHGGHTLLEGGTQIDMKNINRMTYKNSLLKVQGGCIWYDIIKYLVSYDRTIAVSQSYFNFSVGGSISVNCHGRDVRYGSISNTIKSLKIMLSNGEIVYADRNINKDLFDGVIGGYGMLGIIIEAILLTTINEKLECIVREENRIPSFNESFENIVFYNSVIYTEKLNKIYNYYWIKTNKNLTTKDKIKPKKDIYITSMIQEQLLRLFRIPNVIRSELEPLQENGKVHYKSYEIGYDANERQPLSKHPNTTVLQEYFIPKSYIYSFIETLKENVGLLNMINISIRYVKRIKDSVLNYAPVDSYSVVLYFSVINNKFFMHKLRKFTNIMLDKTLECGGKFYLPYLKCYDKEKIFDMYNFNKMFELKSKYDPQNYILNEFIKFII